MNASSENISMLYSILLAFIVVVSWQNYNAAQSTLTDEAAKLQVLWRDAEAFPPDVQQHIKTDLINYIDNIADHEWPLMQQGITLVNSSPYNDLWDTYTHYQPKTQSEAIFLQASVNDLNQISQARKARILAANAELPNGLWFLLIVGAICTIVATMLFDKVQLWLRYTIVGMQSLLLMITFYMINSFEHPYIGLVAINKNAYLHARDIINMKE